jgi:hypothetical protein
MIKVFYVCTHEPLETAIDTALMADCPNPELYTNHEAAQASVDNYNRLFADKEPAHVAEIEVADSYKLDAVAV